jgi:short-subunit dehydrogenase
MTQRLIITGATKGIGKSMVLKFAHVGFDIAFCSRTAFDITQVEQELKTDYGIKVKGWVADLSKKEEVKQFAESAIQFLGGIDVLINNTGVFMPGSIETESDATFELQMATNLNSAYYLSKALIPELKKGNRPHLFNMCSIASVVAYPNGASYCISKFALLGLTKVLREELKTAGVAVTAVLPGATLTESWGETEEPLTRFIRPDDIASSVWNAYLINEQCVIEELVLRPLAGDI